MNRPTNSTESTRMVLIREHRIDAEEGLVRSVSGPSQGGLKEHVFPHLKLFLSWGLGKGWGGESEEERKLFQERAHHTMYRGVPDSYSNFLSVV